MAVLFHFEGSRYKATPVSRLWISFNASFFVFSYGQITKNLKILLSSRKQKGNAIIRRFVIHVMLITG